MHIRFAQADQNFITAQAQQGFYANETEVVRDAVRRLREQREAQQSRFYQAVVKGLEQVEQGQAIPFSRELMAEINQQAITKAASGEKTAYDPDVIPSDNAQ